MHRTPATANVASLRQRQQQMALEVAIRPFGELPPTIVGVDAAYSKTDRRVVGAAVVIDLATLEAVDEASAVGSTNVDYIPGLLAFREVPAVLAAIERLEHRPQLIVCDGQGIAHPDRCGLACHLGVEMNTPTIGCAKNHLTGTYEEPGPQRGDASHLLGDAGDVIGAVLRTQSNVKPLFVSPGHLTDVASSIEIVLALTKRYRQPETTRAADQLANRVLQSLSEQ